MEGEEEPPPSPLFVEGGASAFTSELVPTSRVDDGGSSGRPERARVPADGRADGWGGADAGAAHAVLVQRERSRVGQGGHQG